MDIQHINVNALAKGANARREFKSIGEGTVELGYLGR